MTVRPTRRTLLAATAAFAAIPGLARAQRAAAPGQAAALTPRDVADVARIETYLDGLQRLKSRFLQIAPNGSTAEGAAWLERPGRMRFQYDPPTPLLLVAGHGLVVFHDSELNQTTNIPIGRTPLGMLLAEHVKLSGDVTLTGIERQPNLIAVSLVRTASPGDGTLTLVFNDNPLALRQWSVLDAQGRETRVTLFNIQLGGPAPDPKLFEFVGGM